MNVRPLYQRSRAVFPANAPHGPAGPRIDPRLPRTGRRARERRRSDAHADADTTTALSFGERFASAEREPLGFAHRQLAGISIERPGVPDALAGVVRIG